MAFKGRFFSFTPSSSKKSSDPLTPETSISPKTPIANPPSNKKNPTKSPKAEPQIEFPLHAIPKHQKKKKKNNKNKKNDGDENGSESQLHSFSAHVKKTQKGSADLPLGLRRIKTRSGPLPQECFFDFYDDYNGRVSKAGGCSTSYGENSGKKKAAQSLSKRVLPGNADDDGNFEMGCSRSINQSVNLLNFGELGDSNLQGHSESRRSFGAFTPEAQDFESPRFRALLRATSAPRKMFPGDKKSFSHELNSKGVKPFPFWKRRDLFNLKEVLVVIQEKFDKAKEEVNSELAVFAADLVGILEKNAEVHPEWKETIEDLLVLAQRCSDLKPSEFWVLCEGIVQDLDDQRQGLPVGTLKQLHTRMLFSLTRCTRLLQFHKESGLAEDEHLIGLHHSRILYSADKQVPLGMRRHGENFYIEMSSKITSENKSCNQEQHGLSWKSTSEKKSCNQEQHGLSWKSSQVIQTTGVSQLSADFETAKKFGLSVSRNRKASWKSPSSPAEKNLKEVRQGKDEIYDKGDSLKTLNSRRESPEADQLAIKCPVYPPAKELLQQSSLLPKLQSKVSWGCWGEQQDTYVENSIICRICEEEIPTSYVEDHSRICTIAYRCDHNGLSVNECLIRIAEILEKIVESYSPKELLNATESPNAVKISKPSAGGEDVFSPRGSDWSRRGSEDMLDCLPDTDSSVFVDDLKGLPSIFCKTSSSQKFDQDMATSSAGSMTPRSPLSTPSMTQMDLLLAGRGAFFEHEDLQQINDLAVIARCMVKCMDQEPFPYLITCLENLQVIIHRRKLDALTVQTFGARIEKLLREKYVQLCGLVDDDNFDTTSSVFDEDGPSEDDIVHSLFTSPIHSPKDRTSIDDFEIIKPISRGAFGRVFLAKKRKTGDLFAIKVLKKADMIRKNAVKSVLAERDILISVCNPFVVRFFYSFTCEENLYLVMEYLNGGDLFSMLRSLNRLDEDVACTYIAEIVLALEYLHSLHVVHRDLKPDNLLIAHDGHIKLTDFGLSKVGLINSTDDLSGPAVSGTSSLGEEEPKSEHLQQEQRQKRSAVGTPDYLAPEILLGIAHGTTADWWAVGVILFEMIVGFPPFSADQPQAIFNNILNREIHWPLIPEEMSSEGHDLIDKLLTEDPSMRLGAKGAIEVKQHEFFKNINWDTLARQKAAFVPASENALDTSYFSSRYSWNTSDQHVHSANELEDSSDNDSISDNGSCTSSHHLDEQGDECGGPTEFKSGSASKYSFNNFSFKNLSQLASINYDLLSKGWKDERPTKLDL